MAMTTVSMLVSLPTLTSPNPRRVNRQQAIFIQHRIAYMLPHAVLRNPYLTMEACYKYFVCVENAKIGNVQLEPGNAWTATQHLSII